MNTLRGSRNPEQHPGPKHTPSRSFVASLLFHILLVVGLVRFLVSPAAFILIFGRHNSAEVPVERIGFLQLPKAAGAAVAGRSGGDNRPVSKTQPRKLIGPTLIST